MSKGLNLIVVGNISFNCSKNPKRVTRIKPAFVFVFCDADGDDDGSDDGCVDDGDLR